MTRRGSPATPSPRGLSEAAPVRSATKVLGLESIAKVEVAAVAWDPFWLFASLECRIVLTGGHSFPFAAGIALGLIPTAKKIADYMGVPFELR